MNQQSTYLSTLTPLRGIAALLVVIFHSGLYVTPVIDPAITLFIKQGWLWVDFFFVLSGFVLSHVYGHYFEQSVTRTRFLSYVGARFARVYPLHLFTLIWATMTAVLIRQEAAEIDPFLQPIFSYWGIPASLLLIQSMHLFPLAPLNAPSWSLSTEWWMYMLFPLLVRPLRNLSISGKVLAWLGLAAFYSFLMYYIAPHYSLTHEVTINLIADWGFFRCGAGFGLGMLVYDAYRQNWGRQIAGNGLFFMGAFGAVLLSMHAGLHELLTIALFLPVILSAAYQTGWVKHVFNIRPLQRLGDWSFSIYMVHLPIINIFYVQWVHKNPMLLAHYSLSGPTNPNYTQGQIFCLMLVGITLTVAALTYYFIEVPARRYLNTRFNAKAVSPSPVSVH
ncbi:acyltransferase family protein [Spirosoma gilvum]